MQDDTRNEQNSDSSPQTEQPIDPVTPAGMIAAPEIPPSPQPITAEAEAQTVSGPGPAKSRKVLWIILIIIVLLLAGGAVWYFVFYKKNNPTYQASDLPLKSQTADQRSLCFVRLNRLNCTDADGNNRVRYDFQGLKSGEDVYTMQAAVDQSEFIAQLNSMSDSPDASLPYMLFDKNLTAGQTLTPPSGQTINTPSLSRDGKAVLLELTTADNNRQIYRYSIASAKYAQLTTSGYNTQPVETADGHIVYQHLDKATGSISRWATYVMDKDGSNQQQLPGTNVPADQDSFYSYDAASDTVYAYTISGTVKSVVWYGKVSDLLAGKPANTLPVDIVSSDTVITPLDGGHWLVSGAGNQATIVSSTSGKQTSTIPKYGAVVGWLNTATFKRSNPQQEGKYERIVNLAAAPADLQAFLKPRFDAADADCQKAALTDSSEYIMRIVKVVRDSYAETDESCGDGGAEFYYKDASGNWQKAFGAQQIPNCDTVNKFTYTKEIIPTCYSGTAEVPNQNP